MKTASAETRALVVKAYTSGIATRKQLAEIFGYHIQSIGNWIREFEREAIRPSRVLFEGAADRKMFEVYIKEILAPQLRPGDILIVDNLNVHKSAIVIEVARSFHTEVKFLPAYSPDLNPIEKMWSKIRQILRGYVIQLMQNNANHPEVAKAFLNMVIAIEITAGIPSPVISRALKSQWVGINQRFLKTPYEAFFEDANTQARGVTLLNVKLLLKLQHNIRRLHEHAQIYWFFNFQPSVARLKCYCR